MATTGLSIYEQIKDAVVKGIIGLNLPELNRANVIKGKLATDREADLPDLPGVLVANVGNKAPGRSDGSNSRDDIGYQVIIAILQGSNQSQTLNADRIQNWSERISSKFRFQSLAAVPSVYTCEPMTDTTFDPSMFFKNVDACVQIFKFISREARG